MWNYFIIHRLGLGLKRKIEKFKIGEVFSQNKNEIVFGFYNEKKDQFYWILNLDPSFPHMRFSDNFSRARRNSVNLFTELIDEKIKKKLLN